MDTSFVSAVFRIFLNKLPRKSFLPAGTASKIPATIIASWTIFALGAYCLSINNLVSMFVMTLAPTLCVGA
jgi:hypothetical protein